jgi:K+/H+ antiporter YhaU regulatory subunit KhtT
VLAVGKPGGWQFAPAGRTTLEAGDELFVVGERDGLERFAGAVAAREGGAD